MLPITIKIDDPHIRPKDRHRTNRNGKTYSRTKKKETALAWQITQQMLAHYGPVVIEEDVAVLVEIHGENIRGDIDNYEKFFFDSLQKSGLIKNDSQVKESHCKFFEAPGGHNNSYPLVIHIVKNDPNNWSINPCK